MHYLEWWLRTYSDYPIYLCEQLNSYLFSIVDAAIFEYVGGMSLKDSYAYMDRIYERRRQAAMRILEEAEVV